MWIDGAGQPRNLGRPGRGHDDVEPDGRARARNLRRETGGDRVPACRLPPAQQRTELPADGVEQDPRFPRLDRGTGGRQRGRPRHRQLRGPLVQVDAEAEDGHGRGIRHRDELGQQARDLSTGPPAGLCLATGVEDQHVVGPLHGCGQAGALPDCSRDREAAEKSQPGPPLPGHVHPYDRRRRQRRSAGRVPVASRAATPCRLVLRHQHREVWPGDPRARLPERRRQVRVRGSRPLDSHNAGEGRRGPPALRRVHTPHASRHQGRAVCGHPTNPGNEPRPCPQQIDRYPQLPSYCDRRAR